MKYSLLTLLQLCRDMTISCVARVTPRRRCHCSNTPGEAFFDDSSHHTCLTQAGRSGGDHRTITALAVLDTYELLENILKQHPLRSYYAYGRLSKGWRSLMTNSPISRRKLFQVFDSSVLPKFKEGCAWYDDTVIFNLTAHVKFGQLFGDSLEATDISIPLLASSQWSPSSRSMYLALAPNPELSMQAIQNHPHWYGGRARDPKLASLSTTLWPTWATAPLR